MKLVNFAPEKIYPLIAKFIRRIESSKGVESVSFWMPLNLNKVVQFKPSEKNIGVYFPLVWKIEGDRPQYRFCPNFIIIMDSYGDLLTISNRSTRGSQSTTVAEKFLTHDIEEIRSQARDIASRAPTYEMNFLSSNGGSIYFKSFQEFEEAIKEIDSQISIEKKSKFKYHLDDRKTLFKFETDILDFPKKEIIDVCKQSLQKRFRKTPFRRPFTRIVLEKNMRLDTPLKWNARPHMSSMGSIYFVTDYDILSKEEIESTLEYFEEINSKLSKIRTNLIYRYGLYIKISLPSMVLGKISFRLGDTYSKPQKILIESILTKEKLEKFIDHLEKYLGGDKSIPYPSEPYYEITKKAFIKKIVEIVK